MIFIAKLWGDGNLKTGGKRVICLHGYQDNCGSFDNLVPLLNSNNVYLCFDWPNHGLSSSTPIGIRWTMENYVVTMVQVADHLQWSTFALIGHSMGGQIGKLFAAVYKERINKLVLLDTAGPIDMHPEDIVPITRKALNELLRLEKHCILSTPPEYDRPDDALNRINTRMFGALTDESAKSLMRRYLRPGPGGKLRLANDVRLKVTYTEFFSAGQHFNVVQNLRCPTLLIKATDSVQAYADVYSVFYDMYTKNKYFRFVTVDGNHDVHMNHPCRVAPFVNKFLNTIPSKL